MPSPAGQAKPPDPRIEWIDSPDRFDELAPEWDALAARQGTPFARHEWFGSWWRAFGRGRPHAPVLWRGEELAAAMPMARRRGHLTAMANVHSPHYAPLSRDPESLSLLLDELFRDRNGTLEVPSLPAATERTRVLLDAARGSTRIVLTEPGQVSPIVETDGDFDAWRAVSKRRWHTPIERFRRKMAREHETRIDLLDAPAEPGPAMERGLELEAAGWKGRAGTAILSRADTAAFYRSIAATYAARGELSLSSITVDGRMVAFDLSLLHEGRLYLLKTAYDEGFGRLAPGLVLRLSVIERCFELGLEAHELLGGADEYKLKFSTTDRRHVGLRAYRRLPAPVVRYGYRRSLRPGLRRAYRAVRPRTAG